MSVLKIESKNRICQATINRPEVRNAINFKVMDKLETLLSELEANGQTRCLILRGAGRHFISGGDLRAFQALKTAEEARSMARRMLDILDRIEQLPCWTIASIPGATYGGGCEFMLAFDFCIASSEATFGFTQAKFYLPPGWGGLTRLTERVGRSTALRWLAESRIVQARKALAHHLIDRIANPEKLEPQTWNWAGKLSRSRRPLIQSLKKGTRRFVNERRRAIENELEAFGTCWEDEAHHKAVSRFLKKSNFSD